MNTPSADHVQERLQQNFFGFFNFLSEIKSNPSNTTSTAASSSSSFSPITSTSIMSPSCTENNLSTMDQQISKLFAPSKKEDEETSFPLQIIDSISTNKPLHTFKVEPLVQKLSDLEDANQQLDIFSINEMSPSFSSQSGEEDFQITNTGTFKYGPMSINKFGSKSKVTQHSSADVEYLQENATLRFEDFRVEKFLGRGSSAEVYKVKHIPTNETYALKVVHPHIAISNPRSILVEYKALLDCDHEQVIKLHEVFYIEGSIHMVLDYMNCGSLQNIIEFCKVVPEPVVAKMTKQILKGLAYIHSRSIIHRDIKPQNILVHYDNKHGAKMKIGDFGTAGQKDLLCSSPKQSLFSTFSGSFQYMAPERIDCKNYSYNSDIWSLGFVVLELVTGSFPFKNKDFISVANKLDHFSMELPHHLSPNCKQFIQDCLQVDVTKRPNASALLKYDFIKQNNKSDPSIGKYIYYEYIKKKKSQAFERKFVRELTRNSSTGNVLK